MHYNPANPLEFKFYWLDDQGNQSGFLRSKGRFDGETLHLDDSPIPVVIITDVQYRENRVLLSAIGEDGQPLFIGIQVSGGASAKELKAAVDVARSAGWAKFHQEDLEQEGRADAYRDDVCPNCGATIILTDMEHTPQLYCQFCDSLMTAGRPEEVPPGERDLRLCEECGMFSMPRKFSIFYFWCLLVVYGWRHGSTYRCPACMRGDAWKMLFGNLIFLIGVPNAIIQLARSYGGGIKGGPFDGLDDANIRARDGDLLEALKVYREILERVPCSAGLKYNVGTALLRQGDLERAAESFRLALDDCSNYAPAYGALRHCYEQLGEKEKLEELDRIWGAGEEEQQKDEPMTLEQFEEA